MCNTFKSHDTEEMCCSNCKCNKSAQLDCKSYRTGILSNKMIPLDLATLPPHNNLRIGDPCHLHFLLTHHATNMSTAIKISRKLAQPNLNGGDHAPPHQTAEGLRLDRMPSKDAAKVLATAQDNIVHHLSLHACSTLRPATSLANTTSLARAWGG